MQKILITGGAGFIGSHLAEALLTEGKEVFVIDDLSTGSDNNIVPFQAHRRFHVVRGSVLDPGTLEPIIDQVDFIYHLAAAVGVELVVRRPIHTLNSNVRGTENVLAIAARRRVPVLLTSTSEVYGKSARNAFREDDDLLIGPPTFARWGYACSKLLDEFLAMAYWREWELPIYIARLFNTVGPRQTGQYGMVLPRFVDHALRNEPIEIHGDGLQSRCFCHVSDVVRALVELPRHDRAIGEAYNIGSNEEVTILDLARRVKQFTESQSPLRLIPYDRVYEKGFEDMRRRVPSTEKIYQLMGWRPTHDLADIIRLTVESRRQSEPNIR